MKVTFKCSELDCRLIVVSCLKYDCLLYRNGSVPLDFHRSFVPIDVESKRQRCDIHEKGVSDGTVLVVVEDGRLNSSSTRDGLVRVDGLARFSSFGELLDNRLHFGDARGAADRNQLVNIPLVDAAVTQALLHRAHGIAEIIRGKRFETYTRQRW